MSEEEVDFFVVLGLEDLGFPLGQMIGLVDVGEGVVREDPAPGLVHFDEVALNFLIATKEKMSEQIAEVWCEGRNIRLGAVLADAVQEIEQGQVLPLRLVQHLDYQRCYITSVVLVLNRQLRQPSDLAALHRQSL